MIRPVLVALAPLALAACSAPADPASLNDRGYASLGEGRHADALVVFESALDRLGDDSTDPQVERARWGAIEAACYVDADGAKERLLEWARVDPSSLEPRDFVRVSSWLLDAGEFELAKAVVDAGETARPDDATYARAHAAIQERYLRQDEDGPGRSLEDLGYLSSE